MKYLPLLPLFALLVLGVLPGSARGDHWIWMDAGSLVPDPGSASHLSVVTGSPTEARRVTADQRGDYWAHAGLILPSSVGIDSVVVCYQNQGPESYITQTRLTTMLTPAFSQIIVDEGTDLQGQGSACHRVPIAELEPAGSLNLTLRFQMDPAAYVEIGAIGFHVRNVAVGIPEREYPSGLLLLQNYPNPVRGATWIQYEVREPARVTIEVYSPNGRLVRRLLDAREPAGIRRVQWDAKDDHGRPLAAGVYAYRIRIGDRVGARQMVLVP